MFLNLDLDGVFADYKTKFREVLGYDYHDKPPSEVWPKLDEVPHLFKKLQPFTNARLFFYRYAAQLGIKNTRILTAKPKPTRFLHTSEQDKKEWVWMNLDSFVEVICTDGWQGKREYCKNSQDILIDDSARNVNDWIETGGTGILHKEYYQTYTELRIAISNLQKSSQ